MKRLIMLVFALTLLVACEFSVSTASVRSVELARDYQNGKAVDVTTSFSPTDNPLHCVVTLNNAPDDTRVKVAWTAVEAGDGEYRDQMIDETELETGSGVLDFTLSNNGEWPTGKYKVDVYLNDELNQSAEFLVE